MPKIVNFSNLFAGRGRIPCLILMEFTGFVHH